MDHEQREASPGRSPEQGGTSADELAYRLHHLARGSPGLRPLLSDLLDVDGLRTLVAVLLLEGDLGALAQRTVTVAGDA